jgi:hypothetical protein
MRRPWLLAFAICAAARRRDGPQARRGSSVPDPGGEGAALIGRLSREDLGGDAVGLGAKGRILVTVSGG